MPTTSSCSTTSNSNCGGGGIPGGATTASSFSKSTNSISVRKKPFLFLSNLWRRKKVLGIDDIIFDRELNQRTRSEPSGEMEDRDRININLDYNSTMSLSNCPIPIVLQ